MGKKVYIQRVTTEIQTFRENYYKFWDIWRCNYLLELQQS